MAFGTFRLTGRASVIGGAPASGVIIITAMPSVIVDTASNTIWSSPARVQVTADGTWYADLPTDSSAGNSTTIAYHVTSTLTGVADVIPTDFYARAIGGTVDLADITTTAVVPLQPTGVSSVDFAAFQTSVAATYLTPATAAGLYLPRSTPTQDAPALGMFFPEAHGATGDNSHNDTAGIQAAIDAAVAAGGGIVRFRAVTYLITGTVRVLGNKVTLQGAALRSTLRYTGNAEAVRYGQDIGSALTNCGFESLTITGTSSGTVGLRWTGVQKSSLRDFRIDTFTGTGAIGLLFDSQTDNPTAPINSTDNWCLGGDITSCYTGLRTTRGVGTSATYGPSHNKFYGLRVSSFTAYGIDNDWGENNAYYGCDCSTGVDAATSVRVNDQVCGFYQQRVDNSFGAGNTAVGFRLTTASNGFLIAEPTGNGPTTMFLYDTPAPYGFVFRQSYNYQAGNVRRTIDPTGQDFWIGRNWKNTGGSNLASGEVCIIDTTAEGCVKRASTTVYTPRPLLTHEPINTGAVGGVAERGSVITVSADAGAIAIGDPLIPSTTTGRTDGQVGSNARVMSGKAATTGITATFDLTVGWARTSKAAGSTGTVKCLVW